MVEETETKKAGKVIPQIFKEPERELRNESVIPISYHILF